MAAGSGQCEGRAGASVSDRCRACDGPTVDFASATVLRRYEAQYVRCRSCASIQAVNPVWLPEAYGSAIADLDVGLLDRCLILSDITALVLRTEGLRDGTFLDWAGGYGTLTRLMRDRGFDFSHMDPMAQNVFARGHELTHIDSAYFDLVTSFEVLEHLEHPVEDLQPVASSTNFLLATTHLIPDPAPLPSEWWYYTLGSGQHITLYSRVGLSKLAHRLGFDGVISSSFLHLFFRGRVSPLTRSLIQRPSVACGLGRLFSFPDRHHSLLELDLSNVKAE